MATSSRMAPQGGYEKSDASPRGLLYFAVIMAALLAATALFLIAVFKYSERAENPRPVIAEPFVGTRPLPPAPRIQATPGMDMQSYYESQQQILTSYGWIDRQNGVVRLPIDRAMELILQRGLPTRPAASSTNAASSPNAPKTGGASAAAGGPASSERGGAAP